MENSMPMLTRLQYFLLVGILFFSMLIMSLPMMAELYIIGDIGSGVQQASWGVTFFLLGSICTKPIGRVLCLRYGFYNVIKISLTLTILTCIPILFQNDYNFYLICRYVNGLSSGPIFSAITFLCANQRPKKEMDFFLALALSILVIAPTAGSIFGAVISYADFWRAAYIIMYGIGFIFLILFLIFCKKDVSAKDGPPVDWVGCITFWIGFTGLGFCLITGQLIDGFRSFAFNLVLIVSLAIFVFFLIWNAMHPHRILVFHHFKKEKFFIGVTTLALILSFFSSMNMLLSYWLTLYANYTVKWIAYTLTLTIVGPILLLIVFKYRKTKGSYWMLVLSFAILFGVAFGGSHINVEVDLFRIGIIKIINGFSYAICLPIVVYNIRQSLTDAEFLEGWVFFVVVKLLGYFVGVATFAILWERRAVFYHWRLGGELTPISDPLKATWRWLDYFNFTPLMKEEGLNIALNRQARSLALDDCFYLIAWISLGLLILMILYTLFDIYRSKKSGRKLVLEG